MYMSFVKEEEEEELKESDQYSDLAREMKNKQTMELERDADTNCNRCAQNSQQRIGKRTGAIGNKTRVETIQITTFVGMIKSKFIAQFPVDPFPRPVMFALILSLC